MYFHIITSTACNSKCRYCYVKGFNDCGNKLNEKFSWDFDTPSIIDYPVMKLKEFLQRDKLNNHTLTFYGGEPLLRKNKIIEIIDSLDGLSNVRFMIQTNGLLLDKLPKAYVNRMEKIILSLDGSEALTDFNRGSGTYVKVLSNLKLIRDNGFVGEVIARMVVDEETINHEGLLFNVKHLLSIPGIDSVHWQIDAGFYEYDYSVRDFAGFVNDYNSDVSLLIDWWVDNLRNGKVLMIYPLVGIVYSLLSPGVVDGLLKCGSGFANYTISTNGMISVCPIMHDAKNFQVGSIDDSSPDNLKKVSVGGFCDGCDYLKYCGGRCLYANKAELWPLVGQRLICSSAKHLIDSLSGKIPLIKDLINKGIISKESFVYEKYSGPEIIP